MKEKMIRAGKSGLIPLITVLLICLGIKEVTRIDIDSVDRVTIMYVPNYNVYKSNYLGGYQTSVTSRDDSVIELFIDFMEKMDQRKLREKTVLDPPGFPCYVIQFKYGRSVEAHVTVTTNRAVVDNLPFGASSIYFPTGNPYYDEIEKQMAELIVKSE